MPFSMLHPLLPRPRTTSPQRRRLEDLENRIVVAAFTFFCTSPRQRYFSFDDVLQGLAVIVANLVVVVIIVRVIGSIKLHGRHDLHFRPRNSRPLTLSDILPRQMSMPPLFFLSTRGSVHPTVSCTPTPTDT